MNRCLLAAVAAALVACAGDVPVSPVAAVPCEALELRELATGVFRLRVPKAALSEKTRFLFSTSLISHALGFPSFQGNLSRVVRFERADGKVVMNEVLEGTAMDPALGRPVLLFAFPVVAEDGTSVSLDFNEGISAFFAASDWYSSDFLDPFLGFLTRNELVDLEHAYVADGRTDTRGRVTVRQVGLARRAGVVDVLELRYFLQPYEADTDYSPKPSRQDFRFTGYFESTPHLVAGALFPETWVARFHPEKPVTFAISANTPPAVRDAIRDGVLYWNRARGTDWVRVVDAPEGVSAPDLDFNLIQWVEMRDVLFAYADAQLDPLSGQVRNAQVFLPSAWLADTEDFVLPTIQPSGAGVAALPSRAQAAWRASRGPQLGHTPASGAFGACELLQPERIAAGFARLRAQGISGDALVRATRDFLRGIVAHEVGHTLGLRHNFAGSLGSNISRAEGPALLKAYLETGTWSEDSIPGSSVMEYARIDDQLAIGARIRLGQPALAHDVVAIRALYDDAPVPADPPAFCTDSSVGAFEDCVPFDARASFLEGSDEEADDAPRTAASGFLQALRAAKRYERDELLVFADPRFEAASAAWNRFRLLRVFSDRGALLAPSRMRAPQLAPSPKELRAATKRLLATELAKHGGYAALVDDLGADFDARFDAELEALLSRPENLSGSSIRGTSWTLTADELGTARATAPAFRRAYVEQYARSLVAALTLKDPMDEYFREATGSAAFDLGAGQLMWDPPDETEAQLVAVLAANAARVVFSTSETRTDTVMVRSATPGEPPAARTVAFPVYAYDFATRKLAAGLLDGARATSQDWAYEARAELKRRFEQLTTSVADAPLADLEPEGSGAFARRWILESRQVQSAIEGGGGVPPIPGMIVFP